MFDDPQSMREMLLRARELEAETDDPRTILRAWIRAGLAAADLDSGDFAGARRIAEELAAADDKFTQMNGLRHLALASLALGDDPAAREAVTRYLHGHGTAAIGPPICWLLAALSTTNDAQLAALFIGAAERIETEWGGSGAEAPRTSKHSELTPPKRCAGTSEKSHSIGFARRAATRRYTSSSTGQPCPSKVPQPKRSCPREPGLAIPSWIQFE